MSGGTVSVTMSQARYDALTARAAKDKVTRPEVMRRALDAYVKPAPVVVTEPPAIPAGAIYVSPNGRDTDPGTIDKPRASELDGAVNVRRGGVGTWQRQFDKPTTVLAYPGETVVIDGNGAPTAAVVTAPMKVSPLTGASFTIRGYRPKVEETGSSGYSSALFFGGKSTGSVFTGVVFADTGMDHIGIYQQAITFDSCTFTATAKNPVRGMQADGTTLTGCTIVGFNTAGYPPEPTTAAVKFDRTKNARLARNKVRDGNGAHGLWFDSFCTNPVVVLNDLDGSGVGGRKQMTDCIELEISNGGIVAGNTAVGAQAGLNILDAGNARIWKNTLGGTIASLWMTRDSRVAGADTGGVPIETVGHELCSNQLLAPLKVYDDGLKKYAAADMFTSVRGNQFPTGTAAWWGAKGGAQQQMTAGQLLAALGAKGSAGAVAVPADVAALLA